MQGYRLEGTNLVDSWSREQGASDSWLGKPARVTCMGCTISTADRRVREGRQSEIRTHTHKLHTHMHTHTPRLSLSHTHLVLLQSTYSSLPCASSFSPSTVAAASHAGAALERRRATTPPLIHPCRSLLWRRRASTAAQNETKAQAQAQSTAHRGRMQNMQGQEVFNQWVA